MGEIKHKGSVVLTDNFGKDYGVFNTEQEAYAEIKRQIELLNFKSYYYRLNFLEDGSKWIDYGSHSHFFYLTVIKEELSRE